MVRQPVLALLVITTFAPACRKKDDKASPSGGTLMGRIELSVDSACIQAANVMTPNADGMNDVFCLLQKNIIAFQLQIHNHQGDLVFQNTAHGQCWDGADSTGTGPYNVNVSAITTSGHTLQGQSRLYVLQYGNDGCLSFAGTSVTSDQLDPRICGVTYATNEVFCE